VSVVPYFNDNSYILQNSLKKRFTKIRLAVLLLLQVAERQKVTAKTFREAPQEDACA
jgi:hypothetical protein